MNNFTFRNPTKLVFGKDSILELPKLLPSDAKILLTFGGGSVKRNGVYEAVTSQLSGFQTVEFWGIEPNPKAETLRKAIAGEAGGSHLRPRSGRRECPRCQQAYRQRYPLGA